MALEFLRNSGHDGYHTLLVPAVSSILSKPGTSGSPRKLTTLLKREKQVVMVLSQPLVRL